MSQPQWLFLLDILESHPPSIAIAHCLLNRFAGFRRYYDSDITDSSLK
jgi:hypothetical protein